MIIKDQKELSQGVWTKKRPWLLVLLIAAEAWNFSCGSEFWYKKALEYKYKGWTEASRILMQVSNASNPWSKWGKRAESYIKVRLPRKQISAEIQRKNIEAYNLNACGETEKAIVEFEALIKNHPDFEWPYNNLANIKVDLGDYAEAERLSRQALKINPYYANANITLALALRGQCKRQEAEAHMNEARALLKECGEEKSAGF